jgi:hypothetical protein
LFEKDKSDSWVTLVILILNKIPRQELLIRLAVIKKVIFLPLPGCGYWQFEITMVRQWFLKSNAAQLSLSR